MKQLAASEDLRPMTRKAERRAVSGKVIVQSSAGDRLSSQLRDISAYGCNLACDAEWLRLGRFVSLRLAKDWTIQAIVRWSRDGATGIEFLRPISNHEADLIAALG